MALKINTTHVTMDIGDTYYALTLEDANAIMDALGRATRVEKRWVGREYRDRDLRHVSLPVVATVTLGATPLVTLEAYKAEVAALEALAAETPEEA